MYKKCKVVMLPTNKKSIKPNDLAIVKTLSGNETLKQFNTYCDLLPKEANQIISQHLYILSDEEIKEDDWFLSDLKNKVYKADKNDIQSIKKLDTVYNHHFKVIASTDSSLIFRDLGSSLLNHSRYGINGKELQYNLPSIPQSFIDRYINEYNKGNKIEEIMVEYGDVTTGSIEFDGLKNHTEERLRLDFNNTINIVSIKTAWTKEELNTEAMLFYKKYHGILNQSDMQSIAKFIEEL